MSRPDHRLDDELRTAFKREKPSTDFTMRVLERVSHERAPRRRWWKKVAMLLEPPKLRPKLGWLAIGVTASLLLAIGMIEYSRMKPVAIDENVAAAKNNPAPDANGKDSTTSASEHSAQTSVNNTPMSKRAASSSTNRRLKEPRHQEEQELRAEGEAAKETLMLALSIASSTLNDAQRAVHDDGLKP